MPSPSLLKGTETRWQAHCKTKLIDPESIGSLATSLQAQGKTVATLNGSFDLLHAGHLHILFEASQAADILIVALNTDRSIQEYKSRDRPIIALEDRLQMVAALECVDYVTWFDETDPRTILDAIAPDVHVNGAEYGAKCVEADVVQSQGGRIEVVDLVPGLSTSALVKRIQNLCD